MYTYQHYPMSLYHGGDPNGAHRIVKDASEERVARADGFKAMDAAQDQRALALLEAPPVEEKKPKKGAKNA